MSYFLGVNIEKLPDYVGPLAGALIPVWDPVAKELYKIKASDVLIGGQPTMYKFTAVGGAVENVPFLNGKIVTIVFRGLNLAGYTVTTGTPTSLEVKWDNITNDLTCPAGNDWLPGEVLYIQYIN